MWYIGLPYTPLNWPAAAKTAASLCASPTDLLTVCSEGCEPVGKLVSVTGYCMGQYLNADGVPAVLVISPASFVTN